mmetsp:Transcript_22545/g.33769  ORF Transcript_22545/g.33769 Transcript_22545/m.33769 type:complete len:337 (+) Transcript_22545:85-1095(+)
MSAADCMEMAAEEVAAVSNAAPNPEEAPQKAMADEADGEKSVATPTTTSTADEAAAPATTAVAAVTEEATNPAVVDSPEEAAAHTEVKDAATLLQTEAKSRWVMATEAIKEATARAQGIKADIDQKGFKTWSSEVSVAAQSWLSESLENAKTSAAARSEEAKVQANQAKEVVSERAQQLYTQADQLSKEESVQKTAKGAVVGATALGVGGGAVGAVTGGVTGAMVGLPLALVTFGASIPVGAVLGGGCGAVVGTTAGATAGTVTGGLAGYGYHRKDDIRSAAGTAWGKVSEQAAVARSRAEKVVSGAKDRYAGAGVAQAEPAPASETNAQAAPAQG